MTNLKITGVVKRGNKFRIWYIDLEGIRIYETVKARLKARADMTIKNNKGETPFQLTNYVLLHLHNLVTF